MARELLYRKIVELAARQRAFEEEMKFELHDLVLRVQRLERRNSERPNANTEVRVQPADPDPDFRKRISPELIRGIVWVVSALSAIGAGTAGMSQCGSDPPPNPRERPHWHDHGAHHDSGDDDR